jgi:hypothetical protein
VELTTPHSKKLTVTKVEQYWSTGQNPQWAVVPKEEEEDVIAGRSKVYILYEFQLFINP